MKEKILRWFKSLTSEQKKVFMKEFPIGAATEDVLTKYIVDQPIKVHAAIKKFSGRKGWPVFEAPAKKADSKEPAKKIVAPKAVEAVKVVKSTPAVPVATPEPVKAVTPAPDLVSPAVKDDSKKPLWPWLLALAVSLLILGLATGFINVRFGTQTKAALAAATPAEAREIKIIIQAPTAMPNTATTPIPTQAPTTIVPLTTAPIAADTNAEVALVIERDSIYKVVDTVKKTGTFQPTWPKGTFQSAVGYSNPEEFPDGRTFWTRSQTTSDEVMAFVAKCVAINNGPKYCHSKDNGAVVGLIIGHPDGEYPVKLWDAELKTLVIPGGIENWKAYLYELANFISANKGGKTVEILGPTK